MPDLADLEGVFLANWENSPATFHAERQIDFPRFELQADKLAVLVNIILAYRSEARLCWRRAIEKQASPEMR
jgi:hypothetical protein